MLDGVATLGATVGALASPATCRSRSPPDRPVGGGGVAVAGDVEPVPQRVAAGRPWRADGVRITVTTPLVSRPFVDLTVDVMEAFGVTVTAAGEVPGAGTVLTVPPGGYRAAAYRVEPDASAASYLLAAAALLGGRVTVAGLGAATARATPGSPTCSAPWAPVTRTADATTVTGGPGPSVVGRSTCGTCPTWPRPSPRRCSPTARRGCGGWR